jgi:hypothetical protein
VKHKYACAFKIGRVRYVKKKNVNTINNVNAFPSLIVHISVNVAISYLIVQYFIIAFV